MKRDIIQRVVRLAQPAPRYRGPEPATPMQQPPDWDAHLERLAARAAARLPLFPRRRAGSVTLAERCEA